MTSPEPDIEEEHDDEADREAERRLVLMPVPVGFGNDLVTDDVQHRPSRKGEPPRQEGLG